MKLTIAIILMTLSIALSAKSDEVVKRASGREITVKDDGTWSYVVPYKGPEPNVVKVVVQKKATAHDKAKIKVEGEKQRLGLIADLELQIRLKRKQLKIDSAEKNFRNVIKNKNSDIEKSNKAAKNKAAGVRSEGKKRMTKVKTKSLIDVEKEWEAEYKKKYAKTFKPMEAELKSLKSKKGRYKPQFKYVVGGYGYIETKVTPIRKIDDITLLVYVNNKTLKLVHIDAEKYKSKPFRLYNYVKCTGREQVEISNVDGNVYVCTLIPKY